MAAQPNHALRNTLVRNKLTIRDLKAPNAPLMQGESLFLDRPGGRLDLGTTLYNNGVTAKRASHPRLGYRLWLNRQRAPGARRGYWG